MIYHCFSTNLNSAHNKTTHLRQRARSGIPGEKNKRINKTNIQIDKKAGENSRNLLYAAF